MIEDLPAPREAPNVLARALAVIFGRGYVLVGIAALIVVPWYFLRSSLAQWELAHISDLTVGPWATLAWGIAMRFAVQLVRSVVVVLVALGARQLVNGLSIDLGENLAIMRARWRPLFGVILLWMLGYEVVDLIFSYPLARLWAVAPGIYADAVGVVHALVALCASWSLLCISFGTEGAVEGFLDGLRGPWRLGFRSFTIALVFVAFHLTQRVIGQAISVAFAHSGQAPIVQSYLSTATRGLVEALFVAFLTIVLTVTFLDAGARAARAMQPQPATAQT